MVCFIFCHKSKFYFEARLCWYYFRRLIICTKDIFNWVGGCSPCGIFWINVTRIYSIKVSKKIMENSENFVRWEQMGMNPIPSFITYENRISRPVVVHFVWEGKKMFHLQTWNLFSKYILIMLLKLFFHS